MNMRLPVAVLAIALLAGCNQYEAQKAASSTGTPSTSASTPSTPAPAAAAAPTGGKVHKLPSGLQYEIGRAHV